MSSQTVVRCLVVSLVIALVAPLFLFDVVAFIGPDGAPMSSVGVDPFTTNQLPETRQLFGIEKYRYMFGAGWLWVPYLKTSAINFLIAFVASLGVSIWNAWQRRDA